MTSAITIVTFVFGCAVSFVYGRRTGYHDGHSDGFYEGQMRERRAHDGKR